MQISRAIRELYTVTKDGPPKEAQPVPAEAGKGAVDAAHTPPTKKKAGKKACQ